MKKCLQCNKVLKQRKHLQTFERCVIIFDGHNETQRVDIHIGSGLE
jgi:hypothetical protein